MCDVVWSSRASLPSGRLGVAAASIGGTIYAIGGSNVSELNAVTAYDPATNTWTARAPMPTPRMGLAVAVLGGTIYAIGGYNSASGYLAAVEAYDPASNTWTSKKSLSVPRAWLAAATVGGTLYAFNGDAGSGGYYGILDAYDPATNSWKNLGLPPWNGTRLATAVIGGTIYTIGGWGGSSQEAYVGAYFPQSNTWKYKATMPTARSYLAAAVMGGTIYAVGGEGGPYGFVLATVESFNPATNVWSTNASMPVTREKLAVVSLGGTIYAIGGGASWSGFPAADVNAMTGGGAALVAGLNIVPNAPLTGQWITVSLTITDTGVSGASGLMPALELNSGSSLVTQEGLCAPAGPQVIAASGAITFVWTLSVDGAGTLGLTATVSGGDPCSATTLSVSASAQFRTYQLAAVGDVSAPPTFVGQWITVGLTVTNYGNTDATGVQPVAGFNAGAGLVVPLSGPIPPGPLTIAALSATRFVWSYSVTGAGAVACTLTVTGTDSGTGSPLLSTAFVGFLSLTGGRLASALSLFPTTIKTGSWFSAKLTVTNTGGADVVGVTPSLISGGGAPLVLENGPSPAGPLTLTPGGSAAFSWTFSTTGQGAIWLTATVSGTDTHLGIPTTATSTGAALVATPASATSRLVLSPANACTGQVLSLVLTVSNSGGTSVVFGGAGMGIGYPATILYYLSGPTPAYPVTIPAGGSVPFSFTYQVGAPGPAPFVGNFSGQDALFGNALSTSSAANGSYGSAATLTSSLRTQPGAASVGQWFSVILTVTNTGDAPANGVAPLVAVGPGGSLLGPPLGPAPSGPVSIAGGASQQFTWSYSVSGAGAAIFTATGSGTDSCSGNPLSTSSSDGIALQIPAALSARATALPSAARQGDILTLVLSATDTGEAPAAAVASFAGSSPGSVAVHLLSGPLPGGPLRLAGAASQNFTWTYEAVGSGSLVFTATVSGFDANSLAPLLAASTPPSVSVASAAVLKSNVSLSSPTANVGDALTITFTLTNPGDHDAANVVATLTPSDPAQAEVIGGSPSIAVGTVVSTTSRVLTWIVRLKAPGGSRFTVAAAGVDAVDATPVSTQAAGSLAITRKFGDENVVTYPNPVSGDRLTISLLLKADADEVEIEVYNAVLERIWRGSWRNVAAWDSEFHLDGVLGWAPGPYLIRARATMADGSAAKFPIAKVVVKR